VSALTKLAKGQPCLVRLPAVCNGNPETTVAAHYRSVSLGAGVGIKPHDLFAAHACSACHAAVDGRSKTAFTREQLRLAHAEGVLRSIDKLIKLGAVKC